MKPQEEYEKIEQYIHGELPPEERMKFQRMIQSDPALAQEVELHLTMHTALAEEDVIHLEALLKEVNNEVKLENSNSGNAGGRLFLFFRKYRALAAGLALLLGAILVFQLFVGNNSDPFADNYETYPFLMDTRNVEGSIDQHQQASTAYQNGDFRTAFNLFSQLAQTQKGQAEEWGYRFYTGLSALEIDQDDEAESQLKSVAEHEDNIYSHEAKWYLALIYLKTKRTDRAKEILQRIVSKQTDRSGQAEKLLEKLD